MEPLAMNMHQTMPRRSLWPAARLRLVASWLRACADYYRAAVTYEKLSSLSDAELQRRGLNRASLARDICESAERRQSR